MATPRIRTSIALVGSLTAILLACSGTPERGDATSAIHEWKLGAPTARVGGSSAAGGVQFTSVTHVVPIGEGAAYVTDSKTMSVMKIDADGRELARIGVAGEGPGEFRSISNLWTRGETLFVADSRARRIQLFDTADKLLGQRSVVTTHRQDGSVRISQFVVTNLLSNGNIVRYNRVETPRAGTAPPPRNGSAGVLTIVDTALVVRDTLAWVAVGNSVLTMEVGKNIHFPGYDHFLDTPIWGVARDGSAIALVERFAAPAGATAAKYGVTLWDATGAKIFSSSIDYSPLPIAANVLDSVVNVLADDMKSFYPSIDVPRKLVRDSLQKPAHFPPVMEIDFGTDGSLWLSREGFAPPPFDARRYDIINRSGQLIARLQLQRPGILMAATRDAIWVVEQDSDDVPTLLRYPLLRSQ